MGLGLRLYIVNDDDSLVRIPWAKYERLLNRNPNERLIQYAGQRVRCVDVILDLENRKPVGIRRTNFSYLEFDDKGRLDSAEEEKEIRHALDLLILPDLEPGPRKVIDASQRFARRRFEHTYKWKPSGKLTDNLMNEIFGTKDYEFF